MKYIKNTIYFLIIGFYPLLLQAREVVNHSLPQSKTISISFRQKISTINKTNRQNVKALKQIDILFRAQNITQLTSIHIEGNSLFSESSAKHNRKLAQQRAIAIQKYLQEKYPETLQKISISTSANVNNWQDLEKFVKKSRNFPQKTTVLKIIRSSRTMPQKLKELKQLENGNIYKKYILAKFSPLLRTAKISYTLTTNNSQTIGEENSITSIKKTQSISNERFSKKTLSLLPTVKTNLLFLAATAINLEFEIPLGKNISTAIEGIFPFWVSEKHQFALQMYSGTAEFRYWLGDRNSKENMTGWFIAPYGGYGKYDIEFKRQGIQSTFFHAGLSAGYTHSISSNFRIECSLGLGYMQNKYTTYEAILIDDKWQLAVQNEGTHDWIGPTRAKVSLIWVLRKKS
ncbi:MAG: DUF3575 domain-containing protein [Bacteroidales bacterium]